MEKVWLKRYPPGVPHEVRYDEFAQRLTISAEDLMDLTEARSRAAARLKIEVEGAGDVARLRDALTPYRTTNGQAGTGCRIVVNYSNGAGTVDIPLPEDWRVRGEDRLVAELVAQDLQRKPGFMPVDRRAMHQQSRRLVDYDEPLVPAFVDLASLGPGRYLLPVKGDPAKAYRIVRCDPPGVQVRIR